jgi:hypothetical protein
MHPTRIFKSPDELLEAWEGYKTSLTEEAKKWPVTQYVGKDGVKMTDYPKLPLTLEGFYVYGYRHYGTVKSYFINERELYGDFTTICSRIKEEIRHDQITGGLLGNYNPSITQRLNGLTEKTQTEVTIEQSPFKSLMLDVPTNDSPK